MVNVNEESINIIYLKKPMSLATTYTPPNWEPWLLGDVDSVFLNIIACALNFKFVIFNKLATLAYMP